MSPMCMYSAAPKGKQAGAVTHFHRAHYAARSAGGVGLVMVEAAAVTARGRITPNDLGLWNDEQVAGYTQLVAEVHAGGAMVGIEIAHAGRKASTSAPWDGDCYLDEEHGGWIPVSPSSLAAACAPLPHRLTIEEIRSVITLFADAAMRAELAGFDVLEIHAAHGYLLHSFLSPVTNDRTDRYGGSFDNRIRILVEVVDAVRSIWPANKPLFVRVSSTDWIEENDHDHRKSWTVSQTVKLARILARHGVDLIDASSGGIDDVEIPGNEAYQTEKAEAIRLQSGVATAAVGRIRSIEQARMLVDHGHVDAVFIGRALLRNPSWANQAAVMSGAQPRYLRQYAYSL